MARYAAGSGSTALASRATANLGIVGIRAGAAAIVVYEMAVFAQTAVAMTVGIVRATGGTPTTSITPVAETTGTPLARLDTAWSAQPTLGTVYLRQVGIPAAIGNGYTFVFPDGIIVPATNTLQMVTLTATTPTMWAHVVYDE